MSGLIKLKSLVFCIVLLFSLFVACKENQSKRSDIFSSYRDIPGVTIEEIEAIENIKNQLTQSGRDSFIYGMLSGTDTFLNMDGEIRGYTALLCEWLTELFGVSFVPQHFSWVALLNGLADGSIDFTGELTANDERRKTYVMTDTMAQRTLKYFSIAGGPSISEISRTRLPRYILQEKTTIATDVLHYAGGTFEPVYVLEYDEVYNLLKTGVADALITESVQEAFWDTHGDVESSDFFPLIYSPVSFSTQNSDFAPIISVFQKALENGARRYLSELYEIGYRDYKKHKLYMQLTSEELEFVRQNPVIRLGAEYDYYPVSYFNERYNEWQGIAHDVLEEVSVLSGLEFNVAHDSMVQFFELFRMLEAGELDMLTEVIRSPEREGHFLWPENVVMIERSVLISRVDYRNITLNRIYSERVGLSRGTAHTEFFNTWFPNHPNTIEFDSQQDAFDALMRGDIDLVMNSYSSLLNLTNYQELPDYKVNIMFDNSFASTFGFNKDMELLCSIVDKALAMINTDTIAEQWRHRTYDYRLRLAQARTPWLIAAVALSLIVLALVAGLFERTYRSGKKLEEIVHKRTDELALQTTTLTTLFDSIPDLIFTKNLKLQFLHCNKAFLEHFNKGIDDVVGSSDGDEMGMTDMEAKAFAELDRKVIRERKPITIEEYIPRFDGLRPYYETIKMPLMLNNDVIGILGISRNITERKKMEDNMALSYEYAKRLSDALARITKSPAISNGYLEAAAAVIAQEGCQVLSVNCVGIWSYSKESNYLESISYYNSFSQRNVIQDNYDLSTRQEYLNLLKSERVIVMNNINDCQLISTAFNGYYDRLCGALDAPIRIGGKLFGVVCIEQKCTEVYPDKREWLIEEQNFASSLADLMALAISGYERRMAREAAEIASQTKSSFLANMSHEIRTPMNAILGVTEILIQHETLPAEIEEGLGKIYNSCDLLLGIINDILDFSKIEAGKLDIIPNQYKVASLINDSVHLNMMRIESKPIEFELKIDEKIPAKLIGDELRIKQILNNLLSNAFKYTDSGKVTLFVDFEYNLQTKGVVLVLSVRDTGYGMTEKQLEEMFDEYSRFHYNNKVTVEGTGLGLAITQRLINLMDGKMKVESQVGKGSHFTVYLPQRIVDDEMLGKEVADNLRQFRMSYMKHKKRRQIARDPMPYGKVLVVDDVETNIYVAVGLMKLYRLKIDTAMNGHEAINKIKNGEKYDVIFMDHMMPELDGIEATKIIRELNYDEPIVALTANAVAGQSDMFLQNGFDDFISKPIDIRQLNVVLNKLIRDKQPPEVIEAARRQKVVTEKKETGETEIDPMLLDSFVRDAGRTADLLDELYGKEDFGSDEDLRKFTVAVHGIKSSLWNINEPKLADTAYKLETGGREKNIEMIKSSASEFSGNLRALLEKIESRRSDENIDEDIAEIRGKLKKIQEMCADYNRKGAVDLINDIKNCSIKTRSVLDKIMEYVVHSEFEEAGNAAKTYAADLASDTHSAAKKIKRFTDNKIEGLDIAKGLEKYNGDEKTYAKVLRSYSASIRSMLESMGNVNEDNLYDYRIRVHGIKGTSLDICAIPISRDALELEKASSARDFNYINDNNSEFIRKANKLIDDIDQFTARLEAENPRPKKDKPDTRVLAKLLIACKDSDMDGTDEAMEELEKYQYEADDGLAEWLRENVDRMDLKQIARKLSEMVE